MKKSYPLFFGVCLALTLVAQESAAQEYRKKRQTRIRPETKKESAKNQTADLTLSGQAFDATTAEPLPGARVQLIDSKKGALTDIDGRFSIGGLKPGVYALELSATGYQSKKIVEIKLAPRQKQTLRVLLQDEEAAGAQLATVVIEERMRVTSDAALAAIQRNALQISDGFSGDMILRESPDLLGGTALRRMPGVAFLEDKFLVIRGLSERYNVTTFNNTLLPITDLERNSFDYNIIPSGLVSSIRVVKTVTAEMIGEIGGGLVQFNTVSIPESNSARAFLVLDVNSRSTFQNGTRYDVPDKFLGVFPTLSGLPDNFASTKALSDGGPDKSINYDAGRQISKINPDVAPSAVTAPPGFNFGVNLSRVFKLSKNTPAGFTASFNYIDLYRKEISTSSTVLNYSPTLDMYPVSDKQSATTSFRRQAACLLLNGGVEFGSKGKITFHNLLSFQGENMASDQDGKLTNPYATNTAITYDLQPLRFIGRKLYSGQLNFDYVMPTKQENLRWTLHAETGYSFLHTDDPGYRAAVFVFDNAQQNFIFTNAGFYSRMTIASQNDQIATAKLSTALTKTYSQNFTLTGTGGLFVSAKDKTYRSRLFTLLPLFDSQNQPVTDIPLAELGHDQQDNLFRPENIRPNGLRLDEITGNFDNYNSSALNAAPFIMADARIFKKVRLNAGLRYEYFTQTADVLAQNDVNQSLQLINKRYTNVLPSISAIYSITPKLNVRAAYAQTLNRPIDRELLPIIFFNLNYGTRSLGNPALVQAKLTHYDLRVEFFPGGSDILSITAFYKQFNNAIEQKLTESIAGGAQLYDLANQAQAVAGGIEIEARKNMGFIADRDWLENLTLYANLALQSSRVGVYSLDGLFKDGRRLQGQADYTFNAGIVYNYPKWGVSAAAFYNRVGLQLTVVGTDNLPGFYALPRQALDLQFGKTLGKRLELRLSFVNLFNTSVKWVQLLDPKNGYDSDRDQTVRDVQLSWDTYFSIGYKF